VRAGVVQIPVIIDDVKEFSMNYQHDLIIEEGDETKLIGSIKTSSKDRIGKIFVPNMQTENILKDHIKTFDKLLIEDIWNFL
jgi:hypothetical protein